MNQSASKDTILLSYIDWQQQCSSNWIG